MKHSYIISGAVALTILVTAAGITSTVLAADNTSFKEAFSNFRGRPQELTEAQKAEMQTKMDAVKAALETGNYNDWVAAEKAANENSPVLEKINADNFNRYVDAWKLRQQADSIMAELGVNGFGGMGGRGHGRLDSFGPGRPQNLGATDNN